MKIKNHGYFSIVMMLTAMLMVPSAAMCGDDDIAQMPNCPICGMDRHKFAHSRMVIHYSDGSRYGACSLHCAALELACQPGKLPIKIEVGDFASRQLIDAERAVWVMGGSKMGVMTINAKWAFADTAGADRFISENGGQKVDFETAMTAAYADMYKDTQMIREKRKKMKHMQKGAAASPGEKKHE